MAIVAADAIANTISLFDGLVVIGGGLSGAHSIILPTLVQELNKQLKSFQNNNVQRMEVFAYNFHNPNCLNDFLKDNNRQIKIHNSPQLTSYNPIKKIAVGVSQLGTNHAVALGAYSYALHQLDI